MHRYQGGGCVCRCWRNLQSQRLVHAFVQLQWQGCTNRLLTGLRLAPPKFARTRMTLRIACSPQRGPSLSVPRPAAQQAACSTSAACSWMPMAASLHLMSGCGACLLTSTSTRLHCACMESQRSCFSATAWRPSLSSPSYLRWSEQRSRQACALLRTMLPPTWPASTTLQRSMRYTSGSAQQKCFAQCHSPLRPAQARHERHHGAREDGSLPLPVRQGSPSCTVPSCAARLSRDPGVPHGGPYAQELVVSTSEASDHSRHEQLLIAACNLQALRSLIAAPPVDDRDGRLRAVARVQQSAVLRAAQRSMTPRTFKIGVRVWVTRSRSHGLPES
mmetsp:Transcript_17099/g.46236  ORF Transcript_17099/g.46236 Transcript_17099/m.46236 type:complete len:332 (-) Transcript_17099:134-1129(-)